MYHDNDSALDGFLGLVTLGEVAFFSYGSGQKNMHKQMTDQQRDNEIEQLKKQIQNLQLEEK